MAKSLQIALGIMALILAIIAAASVWTAHNTRALSARLDECLGVQRALTVYVHGRAWDAETEAALVGFRADLILGGRLVGSSVTNASGAWGISAAVQAGVYELRFTAPVGYRIAQVLRAPNVTDFMLASDLQSCTFRVSPNGGVTGDFNVFCAYLATPVVTPTRTPTATPTFLPTPTWTPIPPTVTPTWTPGPTPTPCFRDPPDALIQEIAQRMSAMFPPPDDPLTRFGFDYGFGWPMMEQAVAVNGQGFYGQLWTPFTIIVRWPDGCISVIDSATFQGRF